MEALLPVILIFLAGMTVVGAWHARRVRSAEDFALAGRRLGAPVLAGTLIATWVGTGSLFGFSEWTYENGVAGFLLPVSGLAGMLLLAWIAPRVRGIPASSLPEILGLRFGRPARLLGALALIAAYLVIVSYQYRAGAAVAMQLFPGLEERWLQIGFAAFVILYTALAGMVSVALTDVVNGTIMALGLLLGLVFLWGEWNPQTQPIPGELLHPEITGITWVNKLLPGFLLVLGDANLYQRFMSAKSPATARRAALGAFVGLLVIESAIVAVAFFGRLMLPEPLENAGHVIVATAFTLLPPVIGIMLAATAVAVIISTADSYLLACSTTAANDLGTGMRSPARQRVLVLLFGLAALTLAFTSDSFFDVALYAYTLYGASLTPAVLCALFRPGAPPRAVVGGMAAGLAVALLWQVAGGQDLLPEFLGEWDAVLPSLAANLGTFLALGGLRRPAARS